MRRRMSGAVAWNRAAVATMVAEVAEDQVVQGGGVQVVS
jgi:hypothetical protein